MDVFEAFSKRHSYREGFTSARIPRESLRQIVQAGIQAPSGCNAQTTSFVIVDNPAQIARLAEIVAREVMAKAPAVIVCVADHKPAYKSTSFAAEDCAAAVENMLLAITALGYASVWLDGVLRSEDRARRVATVLGIQDNLDVRVILPVGVPTVARAQRERLPFAQRAWFNRYKAIEE